MKRTLKTSCLLLVSLAAFSQKPAPVRPKITGIDHVAFYTTSPDANRHLYKDVLGLAPAGPIEPGHKDLFWVGLGMPGEQWVGYSPARVAKAPERLDHIAFRTDNITALRAYLAAIGVKVPKSVETRTGGDKSFNVKDPEGHEIEFVQLGPSPLIEFDGKANDPISHLIIHAGFIVHDRTAEDHLFKDILGFHLYWHGGMQNDRDDWVAMQVPDGTDWVEYMLNIKPDADQQLAGVMNHVSFGVKDIKAAQAKLEARGWKPNDREHAQMGRDGKWQLNLYDPDQTRIELMEFTPTGKTCCSEFQGRHPHE